MRFSAASALLALVSSVVAQTGNEDPAFNVINAPAAGAELPVGNTFTIKWTLGSKAGSGKVKILLSGGKDAGTLQPKGSIAAGVENAALKYDWLVDAKFAGEPSYGIQIVDEADSSLWQWSKNFKIVGGSSSGNDTSSSTTTTAASSTTTTSKSSSTSATTTSFSTTARPTSGGNGTSTTGSPSPSGNGTSPGPTSTIRPAAGVHGAAVNAVALIGGLAIAALAL